MNILDTIVAAKKAEVSSRKQARTVRQLEESAWFAQDRHSLCARLLAPLASGIIAEFKRKSPSKGIINGKAQVVPTTAGYVRAGASALSVLTDESFFGGSDRDLTDARVNSCPILRKDFVIDEYQIIEARALGADVVLLIAAILDPPTAKTLATLAHSLGLEVLLEVHNEDEWARHESVGADVVGVNNRNLKTFVVDIATSKELVAILPKEVLKVSESGIDDVAVIRELRAHGYEGFLMGEYFMKHDFPEQAAHRFITELGAP